MKMADFSTGVCNTNNLVHAPRPALNDNTRLALLTPQHNLVLCDHGQYSLTASSRACTACPPGSYMQQGSNHRQIGAHHCTLCEMGTCFLFKTLENGGKMAEM